MASAIWIYTYDNTIKICLMLLKPSYQGKQDGISYSEMWWNIFQIIKMIQHTTIQNGLVYIYIIHQVKEKNYGN